MSAFDSSGCSALIKAVDNEQDKNVTLLLSAGADVSQMDDTWRQTALDIAKERQYTNIIEILELHINKSESGQRREARASRLRFLVQLPPDKGSQTMLQQKMNQLHHSRGRGNSKVKT